MGRFLDDALLKHCLSYLEEASNVSTLDVVDVVTFTAMSHTLLVDVAHDLVELSIDFFVGPVEVHSVLGHFETRGSYTTSVDCLTRSEEHLLFYEVLSSFGRTTHVRRFSYDGYAVSVEHLSIFFVHFVLRSARHSDVYLLLPRLLTSEELSVGELLSVVRDDVVTAGAEVEQRLELLGGVDTVWVET